MNTSRIDRRRLLTGVSQGWAQGLASPPGHILPWSHFSRPHGPDERVERITANLLRRALRG